MRSVSGWTTANIFDAPEPTLDQRIFNGIEPRLSVQKFIIKLYYRALQHKLGVIGTQWADLYLTGSLTTYQYSDTSDCDITVFPEYDLIWKHLNLDPHTARAELVEMGINHLDGTFIPGTQHPIQFFVQPPGVFPTDTFQPGLRSGYNLLDHRWMVKPETSRTHVVPTEFPDAFQRAEDIADKLRMMLDAGKLDSAKELWHEVHRKRQLDQRAELGDYSEGNIVYKWLLHEGLFDRIRDELHEYIAKTTKVDIKGLQDIAEDHKPDGGYGEVAYNPETKTILWVPADWSSNEEIEAAREAFLSMDGVDKVEGDAEQSLPYKQDGHGHLKKPMELEEPWIRIATLIQPLDPMHFKELGAFGYSPVSDQLVLGSTHMAVTDKLLVGQDTKVEGFSRALMKLRPILGWVYEDYETETIKVEFLSDLYYREIVDDPMVKEHVLDLFKQRWPGYRIEEASIENYSPKVQELKREQQTISAIDHLWEDRVTTKVIYDWDRDRIVLGTQATLPDLGNAKIVGEYTDGKVTLYEADKQWINPVYFRRLWHASYPDRELKDVYFRRGIGDEYKLKSLPRKRKEDVEVRR